MGWRGREEVGEIEGMNGKMSDKGTAGKRQKKGQFESLFAKTTALNSFSWAVLSKVQFPFGALQLFTVRCL